MSLVGHLQALPRRSIAVRFTSPASAGTGLSRYEHGEYNKGPVGSGYCCPANYSAIYLAPSLAAVKLGGFPVLFGMTVFAGIVEAARSHPSFHR